MDTTYLDRINELRNKELDKNWSVSKETSVSDKKSKQMRDYETGKKEYRRELTNKRKNYVIQDSVNIDETDFQKFNQYHIDKAIKCDWKKLNINVKMNRLMEYARRLKIIHKLNNDTIEKLNSLLRTLIDDKILTKGQYIVYNSEEGHIDDIPSLVYSCGKYIFDPSIKVKKNKIKKVEKVEKSSEIEKDNEEISSNDSDDNDNNNINDEILKSLNTKNIQKKRTRKVDKKSSENTFISQTKEFKNFVNKNLKARDKLRTKENSACETI